MLARFRHSRQNDFSKHCSPCHSASKNAQYSFREFFRRVKSHSSGLCVEQLSYLQTFSRFPINWYIQRTLISWKIQEKIDFKNFFHFLTFFLKKCFVFFLFQTKTCVLSFTMFTVDQAWHDLAPGQFSKVNLSRELQPELIEILAN